jgi:Ca2+:H+ antiporter
LVLPAAFRIASGATAEGLVRPGVSIAIVLILLYSAYLAFALLNDPLLFCGAGKEADGRGEPGSAARALAMLAAATVGVAWMSEIMVGAIEPTAHTAGLSRAFVGVFLVAIVGNAAEHATAIQAALRDRMDLSLSIAIGSSVPVALFVAPVLVLASLFFGPKPMDPAFPAGLVLMILLSVLITGQVAGDGRSDWLKGAQLLGVYLVLALSFIFLPGSPATH